MRVYPKDLACVVEVPYFGRALTNVYYVLVQLHPLVPQPDSRPGDGSVTARTNSNTSSGQHVSMIIRNCALWIPGVRLQTSMSNFRTGGRRSLTTRRFSCVSGLQVRSAGSFVPLLKSTTGTCASSASIESALGNFPPESTMTT